MSRKSDQKTRVSLFMLVIIFFAMLAQVAAASAQTSVSEQPYCSSPLLRFNASLAETDAPASAAPALLALADVANTGTVAGGGLWLSGDIDEGFRYLQWIVGSPPARLLNIDARGQVSFNLRILSKAASIASENTANQRESIASFVRNDEGLRLLAEVMNGPYRFLLHTGAVAPTLAGNIKNRSVGNLDNRFDSRINPMRRNRQKADSERPPEGFDSLIAINPDVCWFNLYDRRLVPRAQMVFHELAEAHARLVLGLDYLPQGDKPGAHDVAIEREIQLKQQRPWQFVIAQMKWNLVLTSHDDWLHLLDMLRRQKKGGAFRIYE